MNKNITLKKAIIIGGIALVLILLGMIGGITYAKYYARIEGTGNAQIAKWSFSANNATQTMETINLSTLYNEEKIAQNKIAPGTNGSFNIVLDTTGADVAIDYEIKFNNEQNKPTNMKFTCNGITSSTLKGLEEILKGRININDERTKTLTINWDWAYETGLNAEEITNSDIIDTNEAGKDYTFDIVVTGIQVNPND